MGYWTLWINLNKQAFCFVFLVKFAKTVETSYKAFLLVQLFSYSLIVPSGAHELYKKY